MGQSGVPKTMMICIVIKFQEIFNYKYLHKYYFIAHLELISAHYPGHVKIQGILTKLFVAMDSKGRLYAEVHQDIIASIKMRTKLEIISFFYFQSDSSDEATVFVEDFQGSYNTYLSKKYAHLGWYLGIKKSGKWKRGSKTAYGQKAIQFLPVREKFQ